MTALAEVNGKGAYKRRYQATRRLLKNGSGSDQMYTAKQKRAMKGMSPARRAAFKKMLKRAPSIATLQKKRKASAKRKTAPKRKAAPKRMKPNGRRKSTTTRAKMTPNRRKTRAGSTAPRKSDFIEAQMAKGRSRKQAANDWRVAHGRHYSKTAAKGAAKRKRRRVYGKGKYKAVKARIGPKSRFTYKYTSKSRRSGKESLRDIPDHALLGFKTRKAYLEVVRDIGEWGLPPKRARRAKALEKRLDRLAARRERAAERAAKRIRAGRGMFTPNDGSSALSYEEFEDMKMRRNSRKKSTKKKATRKKTTAKRTSSAKRRAAAKKAAATRKRNAAKRSAAAKKAARTRKRKATAKKRSTKRTAKRRSTAKRRTTRRVRRTRVGPRSAAMRRRKGSVRVSYAANKPKRRRKKTAKKRTYKKTITVGRRGHKVRIRYRANRMFKRNEGFVSQLTKSLKLGAVVLGGYLTHRVLTRFIDDNVTSKVGALNEGTLGKYRTLISGVATAAIGIPGAIAASRAIKKPDIAAPIAGGMAASLIQSLIVTVMGEVAPEYAGYFSNYANAGGSATPGGVLGSYYTLPQAGMGSYYEFQPHQIMPAAGMGSMLTQAAAGMGQLTQAAAGFGQPMLTQAAAGMGQAMLTQAAAGTGEYVAYAANGIGEYEETSVSASPMMVDEGIHPNLHSAEQALTVAEAAAGVGAADIPLQSTVEPTVIADPISDAPSGSRAGVFQGGDGIFA